MPSSDVQSINLLDIKLPTRYRKEYGDLKGLQESLKRLGTIHPIVLARSNGEYTLVAGGRRHAAMKELKVGELFHGSTLNPERLGFVFEDEVPEDVKREAELDENLYRLNTRWHEDVLLIADVHELKKSIHGLKDWGEVQTSDLLGKGYGKTKVSNAIRLAKLIRSGDKDIIQCETMSHAMAVFYKRKEEEALAEAHRRSASSTDAFLDTINIDLGGSPSRVNLDEAVESKSVETGRIQATADRPAGQPSEPVSDTVVEVPLSRMFVLGDCLKLMPSLPKEAFDHIVTDIPYGIPMENLDTMVNLADVEKEHAVDYSINLMEPFLRESFRLVKSGGFCVFFYDLDYHEYLQSLAYQIGWKIQAWPLIAHKTSACRNSTAQYNFTKDYECAMVLRRDEQTVLRSPQGGSVWTGDFAAERRLYNNPFAKPFELWKWIYDAIAFQGQKVLDPFCGEMSASRAAVNCGLTPFGIEISDKHYLRGLELMKSVYSLVFGSNVKFV